MDRAGPPVLAAAKEQLSAGREGVDLGAEIGIRADLAPLGNLRVSDGREHRQPEYGGPEGTEGFHCEATRLAGDAVLRSSASLATASG